MFPPPAPGDEIDALDAEGAWCRARVINMAGEDGVLVNFLGWPSKFNRKVGPGEYRVRIETPKKGKRVPGRRVSIMFTSFKYFLKSYY